MASVKGWVPPAAGCDRRPSPAPASAGTGTPPTAPQRTAPALPRRRSGRPCRLVEEGQVGVGLLGPAARRSMSRTWGLLPTSGNALPERGLGFAPPNERRRRGLPQDRRRRHEVAPFEAGPPSD